jgi:hypothetical protein
MAKVKYVMLLPLTYNDGSRVPKAVRDEIFDRIFVLAGGWTIAGAAKGAYRMKSGEKQIDHSLQVWVDIEKSDVDALKQLVGEICALLDQETMYLERADGAVEFIPPAQPKGGQNEE